MVTEVVLCVRCPISHLPMQVQVGDIDLAPSTGGVGIAIHWPCDGCDVTHQKLLTAAGFDWLQQQGFPFFEVLGFSEILGGDR